ncbi:MAG: hypothetical protein CVV44_22325 [Spirochaetae bacterium HGW-Spirochaetae-1]|jgi:hypothetical protein|nr:MAG: hypothetical protein CVV44_22325 [Spirochaetae bacterium HGW-Spirochaetae-1]
MKENLHKHIPAIVIFLFISCTADIRQFNHVAIAIEDRNSILTEEEVRQILPHHIIAPSERDVLEITVFRFSSGIERLNYDGNDTFTEETRNGEIKVLLKIRSGNRVRKVFFIQASGKDKEEILRNLALELERTFPGR